MISTNLTGSQNPIGMPGTGTGKGGFGQRQRICPGLGVSSLPPALTFTGPMVIGKRQDQQMSLIGLTNLPGQALRELDWFNNKSPNMTTIAISLIILSDEIRALAVIGIIIGFGGRFFISDVPKIPPWNHSLWDHLFLLSGLVFVWLWVLQCLLYMYL